MTTGTKMNQTRDQILAEYGCVARTLCDGTIRTGEKMLLKDAKECQDALRKAGIPCSAASPDGQWYYLFL